MCRLWNDHVIGLCRAWKLRGVEACTGVLSKKGGRYKFEEHLCFLDLHGVTVQRMKKEAET